LSIIDFPIKTIEIRRKEMAEFDAKKMDDAAEKASEELDKIREEHEEGVKAVEEWVKKWVLSAGYKRLAKILAGRL
jgi:hypothetical protein